MPFREFIGQATLIEPHCPKAVAPSATVWLSSPNGPATFFAPCATPSDSKANPLPKGCATGTRPNGKECKPWYTFNEGGFGSIETRSN